MSSAPPGSDGVIKSRGRLSTAPRRPRKRGQGACPRGELPTVPYAEPLHPRADTPGLLPPDVPQELVERQQVHPRLSRRRTGDCEDRVLPTRDMEAQVP